MPPSLSRSRVSTPAEMLSGLRANPHLWILTLDEPHGPPNIGACAPMLSDNEQLRYHRYLRDDDRRLFLTAHVFLRQTLSRYAEVSPADWRFATNRHGRPEPANETSPPGLRFNLAHTAGMVTVLVHDEADGGVDVEHLGNVADPAAMAKTVFAETELRHFLARDSAQQEFAFYRLWTLKESFMKAKGMGLALPLKAFAFSDLDEPAISVVCGADIDAAPHEWQFTVHQPTPKFVVATSYRTRASRRQPALSVFTGHLDDPVCPGR